MNSDLMRGLPPLIVGVLSGPVLGEALGPEERFQDLRRRLLFAGQRFADRPVIGTVETSAR